ncbi:MAG: hypothetical protein M1825_001376 [Sarcosagium campestre]|nr:MAG: hypothetical protein M1825_001376 [Sarcosagium campestre]
MVNAFLRPFRSKGLLQPFRLLTQDVRNIRSRYVSDWTVFNQLILASAVYVFFANLLPGITFASDLYNLTGKNWGTIEIVFSTGLCGVIFSLFSIQPLTILGVTGPFAILAENIYELCISSFNIEFLPFMAWTLIHSAWMHYLLAIFNAHDWTMRYVTNFSTEIFSLLNSIIYVHKAIQELERAHAKTSFASFLYAIIGAIGTFLVAVFLSTADPHWRPLFHRWVRMGLTEYAAAISIILFIGMPHVGELATLDQQRLQVSDVSFRPTSPDRSAFLVPFWRLPAGWAAAAIIPGFIVTVLFFFDHEVSSIICTADRYGTVKPTGYAWDIALLGTTSALCGILGIPPANGLLPQAPLHSESLLHTAKPKATPPSPPTPPGPNGADTTMASASHAPPANEKDGTSASTSSTTTTTTTTAPSQSVYEQRWSHFLHAGAILAFSSPPLMHVLGLTPTSVLAGLFLFMAQQSLAVNPILYRTFNALTPPSELPPLPDGVGTPGYGGVHAYTALQIVCTVVVFIVTLTKGAPAFPVIIVALVPFRLWVMPRLWKPAVLAHVDDWACRTESPRVDGTLEGTAGAAGPEQQQQQQREYGNGNV